MVFTQFKRWLIINHPVEEDFECGCPDHEEHIDCECCFWCHDNNLMVDHYNRLVFAESCAAIRNLYQYEWPEILADFMEAQCLT